MVKFSALYILLYDDRRTPTWQQIEFSASNATAAESIARDLLARMDATVGGQRMFWEIGAPGAFSNLEGTPAKRIG